MPGQETFKSLLVVAAEHPRILTEVAKEPTEEELALIAKVTGTPNPRHFVYHPSH